MTANSNGAHPAPPPPSPGSAVYVDTENLQDNDRARDIVAQVIGNWPDACPPLAGLSLYVRADKTAMWQLWADAEYPALCVRVRGVQHFTNNKAKNSADLAITADAIGDLATGQAATIAVVSNDSDFGALFIKVKELASAAGPEQTPFLWITTADGSSGISPEIARFIPERLRWDLSAAPTAAATAASPEPETAPQPAASTAPTPAKAPPPAETPAPPPASPDGAVSNAAIADELIRRLPIGRFKVADAQKVIRNRWPKMPVAGDSSKLGQHLLKEVWPLLEKHGVTMPRKTSPRTYEITQAAKDTLARAGTPASRSKADDTPPAPSPAPAPPQSSAEPTPEQLAAAVASAITDDIFNASDAQPAIKARWPRHPAAATTAQRFGTWFAEQLWPVMEQHGVVLAKEKPRRYEMTPDARHRLTALD